MSWERAALVLHLVHGACQAHNIIHDFIWNGSMNEGTGSVQPDRARDEYHCHIHGAH